MVFSNQLFLFVFLPALLVAYFSIGRLLPAGRNLILLSFSILFYAVGDASNSILIVASIVFNHFFARYLERITAENKKGNVGISALLLSTGVLMNLLPLIYYKYSNFILEIVAGLTFVDVAPQQTARMHLPLGISFFTFQAISYLVDVYRKQVAAERSLLHTALFICLFPQLIAGPIVRYKEIHKQITQRQHSLQLFSYGVMRFLIGLMKKVVLADSFGVFTNFAFGQNIDEPGFLLAWLGAIAFTLQVYFDFSAYSDMAIGLGALFGFKIPENFRYPYVARSIREFWKRWHITLTTWFRDYLYASIRALPYGRRLKNCNTFLVFVLVGIWHGASWNFVAWGSYYGLFMIFERNGLLRIIERTPRALQHLYVLLVVIVSAVLFRAEDMNQIKTFLVSMFLRNPFAPPGDLLSFHSTTEFIVLIFIGAIAATPIFPWLLLRIKNCIASIESPRVAILSRAVCGVVALSLFGTALTYVSGVVVSREQSPFVYFRF